VVPGSDGAGPGPIVIAVADGMGGAAAGEVASRLAIEAAVAGPAGDTDVARRIHDGNRAVLDAVATHPEMAGMGTTITLGVFDAGGVLHLGHVGDSRAYLLRDGDLSQITSDHTYVMELVARGQLSAEAAATHPRRHLITRVVGMEGIEPDASTLFLEPGDRVMMCSDGLTEMVGDAEIADVLVREPRPSAAAWALVEAANAAGGVDNTTVAVVDAAL
jgi:protein phosphatase